jgi:hypothetical protein
MSEPAPSSVPRALASAGLMIWAGWLLVMGCILVRVQASSIPLPYWDGDPTLSQSPILGLAPSSALLIDVLMMLGAGVSLLGWALAGRRTERWHLVSTILVAVGAIGIAIHSWALQSADIDDVRIGGMWTASMLVGLAALHICGDERLRRLTFALGIGVIMMLAAKGLLQVFIEHPMTVERYRIDRESFLMSQGWAPDSIAARNFERRLSQPEATGWFGMANVYASFAAAGFVAFLGLAALAWRESRVRKTIPDGWAGLLTFGGLAAGGALLLAGGKGGFITAAIGAGLLMLGAATGTMGGRIGGRVARAGGWLAVVLVLSALAAVALRGMIGERIGELSLLFRWFYLQGATRIFAENPLIGVGPAGFKDAYLLAKPPLSPEEVSSPHSVFFDWAAALGLFGLAWVAALLIWAWMAGRWGAEPPTDAAGGPKDLATSAARGSFESGEERADARLILLPVAVTMLISAWLEQLGMTLEAGIMRFLGAAAWVGVAVAALALMRRSNWRWIGVCSVLVLIVHGQIEMTPVWPGASALMMLLVGCMAAPPRSAAMAPSRPARSGAISAAAVMLAAGVSWAWLGLVPVMRWQGELRAASDAVRPLSLVRERVMAANAGHAAIPGDSWARIAADLGALLGRRGPASPAEFERAMHDLTARTAKGAEERLLLAVEHSGWHPPTVEALVRMLLLRAAAEGELAGEGAAMTTVEQAAETARRTVEHRPSATTYGMLGNVMAARAATGDERALQAAIEAWAKASELDPYGLPFPLRIYRTLERLGETHSARGMTWAERVLETDEMLRLDEVRRLDKAERDRIRAALEAARQAG